LKLFHDRGHPAAAARENWSVEYLLRRDAEGCIELANSVSELSTIPRSRGDSDADEEQARGKTRGALETTAQSGVHG